MAFNPAQKRKELDQYSLNDVPVLRDQLATIGKELEDCQKLAYDMGLSEKYGMLAGTSMARFVRLFEKDCKVPMTEPNLSFHAEMRGRMSERLCLSLEMASVKSRIKERISIRERFTKLLAQLLEKGQKDNDN